ncbi:MAG TPA: ABC transporter substrate-binding protein [Bryobacteraceae bacterium]|nr:ABC transporter substrate-binding protein [Bryobacteraceae bacterium]
MALRILVSRHSVFYSPLISTIAGGFLERQGLSAEYGILQTGQRSADLIREGAADIIQSAVSSNWKLLESGECPLPVHFAQINERDGFFLVARRSESAFTWNDLEGAALIADHGWQPLTMLRFAARTNGVDWSRVRLVNRGAPEAMQRAYRGGEGDYIHLQAPAAHQLEADQLGRIVVSVGASMPRVAFSSLCASREFLRTETCRSFLTAYRQSREWVRSASPEDVARAETDFFPGVAPAILATAIRAYQKVGNWEGGIEIPRDLYEQALTVFEGEIQRRHPYDQVCAAPSVAAA